MPTTPDKPPKVSLVLDELEREGDAPQPFVVAIGDAGRPVVFSDPNEVDWRDLLEILSNPARFFEIAIADAKDRERISRVPMPTWKLRQLSDAYRRHYGLLAPGEAPASPA